MTNNSFINFLGPVDEPLKLLRYILVAIFTIITTVCLEEVMLFLKFGRIELALLFIMSSFFISAYTPSCAINLTVAIINPLLYDYLVVGRRMEFTFTKEFPTTLLVMIFISVITCFIITRIKDKLENTEKYERQAALMLEISKEMNKANDIEEIAHITCEYLSLNSISGIFYLGNPDDNNYMAFTSIEALEIKEIPPEVKKEAHEYYMNPRLYERNIYKKLERHYIPIMTKGNPFGVACLCGHEKHLSESRIYFANILLNQTALAIELQKAKIEYTRTMVLAEKEKIRGNLLSAISHDLRTPLSCILSASSIIEERTGDPLATDIKQGSEWLINVVENLLTVTRISDKSNKIVKTPEAAEEVMAKAANVVRMQFPDCNIVLNAPDELIIIDMDAMLISQVFINILMNAAEFGPKKEIITFNLYIEENSACFTIGDSGRGIPEDLLDGIFDQQTVRDRRAVDSAKGMGLGLSICKTIVDVHGGHILAENKPEGGALFTVKLPLSE